MAPLKGEQDIKGMVTQVSVGVQNKTARPASVAAFMGVLVLAIASGPSTAQEDEWKVTLAPYGQATGLRANATHLCSAGAVSLGTTTTVLAWTPT